VALDRFARRSAIISRVSPHTMSEQFVEDRIR
jgi:hypothetical protein